MPISREASEIVSAIKENTRELKRVREELTKVAKNTTTTDVKFQYSGFSPEPLQLDRVDHDYVEGDYPLWAALQKHFNHAQFNQVLAALDAEGFKIVPQ